MNRGARLTSIPTVVLKGGRNFRVNQPTAALWIVTELMRNGVDGHFVVRKVGATLRDSVYATTSKAPLKFPWR